MHICIRGRTNVSLEFLILMLFWWFIYGNYQFYWLGKLSAIFQNHRPVLWGAQAATVLSSKDKFREGHKKLTDHWNTVFPTLFFCSLCSHCLSAICSLKLRNACLLSLFSEVVDQAQDHLHVQLVAVLQSICTATISALPQYCRTTVSDFSLLPILQFWGFSQNQIVYQDPEHWKSLPGSAYQNWTPFMLSFHTQFPDCMTNSNTFRFLLNVLIDTQIYQVQWTN